MPHSTRGNGDDDGSGSKSRSRRIIRWFQKLLRIRNGDSSLKESLEDVIEEHDASTEAMAPQERLMLMNILHFGDLRVDDVMVPRADIIAVDESDSFPDLIGVFHSASHSRLPVYRETLDDPIGMYHIKDLVGLFTNEHDIQKISAATIADLRRPVLYAPPSMPVIDLFVKMQATRVHMALVIDEYGGTDGLVTIEDLVEEVFGEIEDEHDIEETSRIERLREGDYVVDARFEIEELQAETGFNLVDEEDKEDIDTVGGLIFSLVDRVPQRGELIKHPCGAEFEILDADPRRIKKVRMRYKKQSPAIGTSKTSMALDG